MSSVSIPLGTTSSLIKLFSYPNEANSTEPLTETILHWINQSLARDGFAAKGASADVQVDDGRYTLKIDGPKGIELYAERIPLFLKNGADSLKVLAAVKKMKRKGSSIPGSKAKKKAWPTWVNPPLADKLWDPQGTGTWRFFLPVGMAMVNQVTLNYFHYPPMRLLDEMRDYLADPVPVRLIELMKANGIKTEEEAWLYSTVMDGAPIAAPDDQGTIYKGNGDFSDPVHLIPIDQFHEYQEAQTKLLLNEYDDNYTIPIVVYGTSARESFNAIWKAGLSTRTKPATTSEVIPGKKTAVLCSGHPYAFFAQVQEEVGAGWMLPETWPNAVKTMTRDLSTIRWQVRLSKDPTLDPVAEWESCFAYWNEDAQLEKVYQLVMHQGTLWYPDPKSLEFVFKSSMEDVAERAKDAAKAAISARKWESYSKPSTSKSKKSKTKSSKSSGKKSTAKKKSK